MGNSITTGILRSLRQCFGAANEGLADRELLARFVQRRDEAAFELLVWRHAEMVLNVCRQILRDQTAVEDAFQATFVVLIRKAAAILHGEALAAWLHRVAYRTALRARGRSAREQARVEPGIDLDLLPMPANDAGLDPDVRAMLHEEISRLPARYREAVVYCYLESRTHEETARQLGWSKGTVAGRLARARELLRQRLARRGVALSAALLVAELSRGMATAALAGRVPLLVQALRSLANGGPALAGMVSPGAIALAEGVIRQMFWTHVKWVLAVVVAACLIGPGAALLKVRRSQAELEAAAAAAAQRGEERPPSGATGEGGRPATRADDHLDEIGKRLLVRRNLRELALALHNYNDVHGHLPPPAITDKTGKPLLSWRVAILPFIDQDALYKEFKLNESWDSPHNKKLLAKMPRIFAPMGGKTAGTHSTFYQYIVGPEAVFTQWKGWVGPQGGTGMPGGPLSPFGAGPPGSGGGPAGGISGPRHGPSGGTGVGGGPGGSRSTAGPGASMPGSGMPAMGPRDGLVRLPSSIPDGLSNTLLIVEASTAVPWTKPADVAYHPKQRVPRLGGQFRTVFHAAFADGTVRALPRTIDAATLRALITPAGGEVVDLNKLEDPATGGSTIRKEAMARLRQRNAALKEEAATVRAILLELRAELQDLRWAMEEERLLKLDPAAAALQKENGQLEKVLRETRDEARKIAADIQRLKQELKKRGKK
jgi:RNA polymerase sigma factor (sigma-70 family)